MDPFHVPATLEAQDAQSCSDADQVEVLALVCTAVADARTMCAALCTSSSARQAILANCSSGLQLQLKAKVNNLDATTDTDTLAAVRRLLQHTAWLARHRGLVGQLQLQSAAGMLPADEMAWSLRPPLQLRCLQLHVSRPVLLLQQLDPSRLARLELVFTSLYDNTPTLLPAALSRLTGLQQLVMTGSWRPLHASMAAVLAGMQQLTQLVVQPQLPAAALAQLPSQLVGLQLSNPDCEAAELVAHVRSLHWLQSLTLLYDTVHKDFAPGHHAEAWGSIPQLKQLDIDGAGWHESQLRADVATGIAAATSLARLYCGFQACSPDIDLLAMLSPLKRLISLELELNSYTLSGPPRSFKRLLCCDLTQLQSLALDMPRLPQLALAQVCLQATQLTELTLSCEGLTDDNLVMIADSMVELQRLAVAGSTRLTSDGLMSALAPPNLPRLEQLATWNRELATAQRRAAVADSLSKARPTVSVAIEARRKDIPSGFVGAYCY